MAQWTPMVGLKRYGVIVGRKMLFIALGWIIVYFVSQPFRAEPKESLVNILMLFAPMIGALAGLIAGWYMATDAVEDSGMSGLTLWFILVMASVLPMWITEGIMHLIFRTWNFGLAGWMLMTAANLLALATAVWLASSQE